MLLYSLQKLNEIFQEKPWNYYQRPRSNSQNPTPNNNIYLLKWCNYSKMSKKWVQQRYPKQKFPINIQKYLYFSQLLFTPEKTSPPTKKMAPKRQRRQQKNLYLTAKRTDEYLRKKRTLHYIFSKEKRKIHLLFD